jgi:hypothetical protein
MSRADGDNDYRRISDNDTPSGPVFARLPFGNFYASDDSQ